MHHACTHATHAHHDITRFVYDANHVTMTSTVPAFHLCHVGMRWHDIIGVCIVGTLHHHGSHCMGMTGMTSLCSHHVHIMLTMSSCSNHDVIVTCVNHDFSRGT